MELEKICMEVCDIAKETGIFIKDNVLKISGENIDRKGVHDFVTYVDKTSEQKIVNRLIKILPDSGFIVEENTIDKKSDDFNWVIDPLDGTTNYIHGLAPYAISIALMKHDEVLLGVVFEVGAHECFYTWKNSPSFLDGNIIKVSEIEKVNDSLIATGFPYYDYKRVKPFLATLEFFMNNSHGIRRLGSAATDLAYVACGRFEAFYEYSLSPWDVAAGSLIVKNADGLTGDFSGSKNFIFGKEIIASNAKIYKEFLNIINNIMGKINH
ncbi:MAG: inositol monophosphatase family protein [Bacteroidota bacterium]